MFMQLFPYSYNLAAINPLLRFSHIICCVLYLVYFVFVDCLYFRHYIIFTHFSTYSHLISPHKSLCVYLFTMNPACLLSPIASFNLPSQVAMCLFVYYEPGMFTLPNCVSSVVWPVFVLFLCFVFSLHVLLNHAVSSWCGGGEAVLCTLRGSRVCLGADSWFGYINFLKHAG